MSTIKDPKHWSYIVRRNAEVSVWRKQRAVARGLVRAAKARVQDAQARAREDARARAREELRGILSSVSVHADKLACLAGVYLLGLSPVQIAAYAGISRANVDQKVKRAKDLVCPLASPELRQLLRR